MAGCLGGVGDGTSVSCSTGWDAIREATDTCSGSHPIEYDPKYCEGPIRLG